MGIDPSPCYLQTMATNNNPINMLYLTLCYVTCKILPETKTLPIQLPPVNYKIITPNAR